MDELTARKQAIAADDALRSRVSRLQDGVTSLQQQIDAAGDIDTLATLCDTAWQQIKSIDIVLHEVLIHDHPNPDPLSPSPTDSIAECIGSALDQVRGVMATEYEPDVACKRLRMASALARRALESLESQIEAMTDEL